MIFRVQLRGSEVVRCAPVEPERVGDDDVMFVVASNERGAADAASRICRERANKRAGHLKRAQMLASQYGRLTPIAEDIPVKGRPRKVTCICDCGATAIVRRDGLTRGKTQSCGCLQREAAVLVGRSHRTHGHSWSPTWACWQSMHRRCSPKWKGRAWYYDLGIRVCARWGKFENFLEDMGPRPSTEHTVERRDNTKGYEPSNCVWATWDVQMKNRRPWGTIINKRRDAARAATGG